MMTGDEYRDSLRKLKREIYYMGERIEDVVEHIEVTSEMESVPA